MQKSEMLNLYGCLAASQDCLFGKHIRVGCHTSRRADEVRLRKGEDVVSHVPGLPSRDGIRQSQCDGWPSQGAHDGSAGTAPAPPPRPWHVCGRPPLGLGCLSVSEGWGPQPGMQCSCQGACLKSQLVCSRGIQAAVQQPASGRKALRRQCNLCCPAQAGSKLRQAVRLAGPISRLIACRSGAHQRHDVLLVGYGQAPAPPEDACSRHLLLSATWQRICQPITSQGCLPVETFSFLDRFCSPKKLNTCSQ